MGAWKQRVGSTLGAGELLCFSGAVQMQVSSSGPSLDTGWPAVERRWQGSCSLCLFLPHSSLCLIDCEDGNHRLLPGCVVEGSRRSSAAKVPHCGVVFHFSPVILWGCGALDHFLLSCFCFLPPAPGPRGLPALQQRCRQSQHRRSQDQNVEASRVVTGVGRVPMALAPTEVG